MNIAKQYAVALILTVMFAGLMLTLIVAFQTIDKDQQQQGDMLLALDKKYNLLHEEMTEIDNKQQKIMMLMGVYRDGINTLKVKMDEYNVALVEGLDELAGSQELLNESVESLRLTLPPVNFDEPMDDPIIEEDFSIFEEEVVTEETELVVSDPTPEPAPVVFTCPERDRSVSLDRYIRRIDFNQTTSVSLNYDVMNGEITNMYFNEGKGNVGRRLYEALEKYLLDSAMIVEPEGRGCRLPFRIVVE
jgi:hypothetical protein|tara:strand:+ start:242 stop:982 length:741 start_codon:yes stop_codon:yes gene_type:complete